MSQSLPAGCACPTPVVVSVPGTTGATGADGTDGVNAFSIVQTDFTVPAIGASVSVLIDDSSWVTVGQNVFVFGGGYFQVNSNVSNVVGLTYLNYNGNTASGLVVVSGSKLSPAGTQPPFDYPITIDLGGTGAASKSLAQYSLGLGVAPMDVVVTSLQQPITNISTLVAGAAVSATYGGRYLILATVTLEFDGATFASDQTVTVLVENVTAAATICSAVKNTGKLSPQYSPYSSQYSSSTDYVAPFVQSTLSVGDVVAIKIALSAAPSTGAVNVTAANLTIVPLALT